MPESSGQSDLGEGDGKTTSTQVPNEQNSGNLGQQGRGVVPNTSKNMKPSMSAGPSETFGSSFDTQDKRSPFVEMLMGRIKQNKQQSQEKQSMDITPQMLSAFQDELGHLRQEKTAFLGAIGKSVLSVGGRAAKAMGAGKGYGRAVGRGMDRLGGVRSGPVQGAAGHAKRLANRTHGRKRMQKIVGGAALGTAALGAAGTGAALS